MHAPVESHACLTCSIPSEKKNPLTPHYKRTQDGGPETQLHQNSPSE